MHRTIICRGMIPTSRTRSGLRTNKGTFKRRLGAVIDGEGLWDGEETLAMSKSISGMMLGNNDELSLLDACSASSHVEG